MDTNQNQIQPLPKKTRNHRRLLNHLWLAAVSLSVTGGLYLVLSLVYPSPRLWIFRWSLATAYVGTGLLAITLSIGAWRLWKNQSTPISNDLRRDFGIWCAVFAIAHTFIGLNVHQKNWAHYFFDDAGGWRTDLFGFVNYIGVAATLIVIALLLTSSDFALKTLKSKRWKRIQRWNYLFAALVALHGIFYIVVEKRIVPFLFIFAVFVVWMAAIQFIGFRKKRGLNGAEIDKNESVL